MAFLYLSLAQDCQLAAYQIDANTGTLEYLHAIPVPGEPSVQGIDPKHRTLFVAMRSTGQLLSFRIAPKTGQLELLHTINTGYEDPAYFKTDRNGRFLLTPYYASGKVTVYPISADGAAREPLSATVSTDLHAHGLTFDPSERYVFVPHTCPTNAIFQFHFNAGKLIPNSVPKITPDQALGPRHIHFHPNGRFLYAVNEQGNSVTVYNFDPDTGTLAPEQCLSTVPAGFNNGACARLEFHPSGRFLYAANRGHDSLAVFAVDADSGTLETRGQFPTEANPRSFDITPDGRFLYAAGESTDRLAAYRIDLHNGALEPLTTYKTGKMPWWVHIVEPSLI